MEFETVIKKILDNDFGLFADKVFEQSLLIRYLAKKTVSANRGSKSRSSFANIYAVYVLVEDYIKKGFVSSGKYTEYEGAKYSDLLTRTRQLPFGEKLQNHALNNRMSSEFHKFFPDSRIEPIPRNVTSKRYWINEGLLKVNIDGTCLNIAQSVIEIIDAYVKNKQKSFEKFVKDCEQLKVIGEQSQEQVETFIKSLLAPNEDARLFEIVSFAVLKYFYHDQHIYWGLSRDAIKEERLSMYKTGRTNANDGGIDFVMKPLGRFFQVTETLDFRKYFLDIDKIEHYPISFVVKVDDDRETIMSTIRHNAEEAYSVKSVVDSYMGCIEEIINIPRLIDCLDEAVGHGYLADILEEIIKQSKVEFNLNSGEYDIT